MIDRRRETAHQRTQRTDLPAANDALQHAVADARSGNQIEPVEGKLLGRVLAGKSALRGNVVGIDDDRVLGALLLAGNCAHQIDGLLRSKRHLELIPVLSWRFTICRQAVVAEPARLSA